MGLRYTYLLALIFVISLAVYLNWYARSRIQNTSHTAENYKKHKQAPHKAPHMISKKIISAQDALSLKNRRLLIQDTMKKKNSLEYPFNGKLLVSSDDVDSNSVILNNTNDIDTIPEESKGIYNFSKNPYPDYIGVFAEIDKLIKQYKNGDQNALFEVLNIGKYNDPLMRAKVVRALSTITAKDIIPEIICFLDDENDFVRCKAAGALGNFHDKRVVYSLMAALNDESSLVKVAAACSLGRIGDKIAVQELIKLLQSDDCLYAPDYFNWYYYEKLFLELNNTDDEIGTFRSAIAEALGEIGDNSAVPYLLVALQDLSPYVRASAAEALGKLNDKSVIPYLYNLFNDEDPRLIGSTAKALIMLGDKSGYDKLDDMLQSDNVFYNIFAAKIYLEMKDNRGVCAIIKSLRNDGFYEPRLVEYASPVFNITLELADINFTEAVPVLIEGFKGDSVDIQIAEILKRLTGQDFGEDKSKWQAWWLANKESLLKEKSEPAANKVSK